MSPDISVVIAHYNSGGMILDAVRSALSQVGVSLEVIVVDDASTDGSFEPVERLATAEARVRPFRMSHNRGPSAARNKGIDHALGTWIAILDADDEFMLERLASLLNFAVSRNADAVADNIRFVSSDHESVDWTSQWSATDQPLTVEQLLVQDTPWEASSVKIGYMKPLIRRAFLVDHGIQYTEQVRLSEDFLIYLDLLVEGAQFYIDPKVGYLANTPSRSLSRGNADIPLRIREAHDLVETRLSTSSSSDLNVARRRRLALSLEVVVINAKAGRYLTAAKNLTAVSPGYAVERVGRFIRNGMRTYASRISAAR